MFMTVFNNGSRDIGSLVGGEPMIWFISDDEKDDFILKDKRPEQFARIRDNATDRLRKHEKEIHGLFPFLPK
jgi:hypothetical protein